MSDLETRLRRTFGDVARHTRAVDRIGAFSGNERRRFSGLTVAAATFVLVTLAVGAPLLLRSPETPTAPAGAPSSLPGAPAEPTTTHDPALDPTSAALGDLDLEANIRPLKDRDPSSEIPTRPPLVTERAMCLFSPTGTPSVNVAAVDVPLDERMTEADLEDWCRSYEPYSDDPVEAYTVCRAEYADTSEYDDAHPVVEGDINGRRPGFPVVFGWEDDCASVELATLPPVNVDANLDLDAINRAREVEIAATRITMAHCLSFEQAWELATSVRDELGEEWRLVEQAEMMPIPPDACHETFIDLQWGAISMMERMVARATGD